MGKPIRRVGVIGAGVMGSGIAAHLANAGIEVLLLDVVPRDLAPHEQATPGARSRVARAGMDAALKARPAAFFHGSCAGLVSVGNIDDDLPKLACYDLVIEAVVERMDIKRSLFERLEAVVGPDTIVASNTSGLRIVEMLEGRGKAFRERFLVMHFFNPVRYMKLLELVVGPDTSDETLERVRSLGVDGLGKGVVLGKDTPNFVGNRIGAHSMMLAIHQMLKDGLSPEDVDAVTGPPMGHPKSASFRTADMVGLDTFVHVADNCHTSLTSDEERHVFEVPAFIRQMVEKKLLGDKTRGGFYKKERDGSIKVLDPANLSYREKAGDPSIKAATKQLASIEDPRERVRRLVADEGKAGSYAWKVMAGSLAYAARRIGEIADSVEAIDDAMRWGYNWELGPFETWDALGVAQTVERMRKDGIALPACIDGMLKAGAPSFYTDDGRVFDLLAGRYVAREVDPRTLPLARVRRGGAPVLANGGAEAWDLGDGVLGLCFKTKANSIDADVIQLLGKVVDRAEQDFRAVLLYNEGEHFCVGANLFMIAIAAQQKQWDQVELAVSTLQQAVQRMKYARVPVVAAPFGMTLGGGLELCLASDGVQAAAETYTGLVEVGVGLIPGGGGNVNMLFRALEAIPEGTHVNTFEYVAQVFKNIAMAKVATSAVEAKRFGYFRGADGVSFDRARLLSEAKARAVGMAESGYHPPVPRGHVLPGESGIATLNMMVDTLQAGGYASEHDGLIARKLAVVLCGGIGGSGREVTEQELLDLEREAFVSLCGEAKSLERMQHILMHNKPLRN